MTEFKPKGQPDDVSTSAAGTKKKGRQNRRTKRGDQTTVSTDLDNSANTIFPTHVGNGSAEDFKSTSQKQWPCLVPSSVYNPDYPTFCECLQPYCPRHCPVARDLLFRRCTDLSWPDPGIVGYNDWSVSSGPRGNCDRQGEERLASVPASSSSLPSSTTKLYAQVVPELASLLDHMQMKEPMLVISTTDGSMDSVLPFQLPPKYGCVILGFFDVESVEVGNDFFRDFSGVLTFRMWQCENGNRPLSSSIQPGTVSWKVRLRYASPSKAKETNGNFTPPWWLSAPDVAEASPSAVVLEPEEGGVDGEATGSGKEQKPKRWCVVEALDGNEGRTWWHCVGCGRINRRDMLVHRRCPSCQVRLISWNRGRGNDNS
jgi:hypothetical protein